jgi:hypothetical protein
VSKALKISIINPSKMNNSSTNSSVYPYLTVDQIQEMLGSTWTLDYFNFYPFVIVGSLGFATNFFSFFVFLHKDLATLALYQYMQVYAISNAVICLLGTFNFLSNSHRIFPWGNAEWAFTYYLHAFVNSANFLYFFNSTLNIFVMLDRIANIKRQLTKWIPLTPYKLSAIAAVCCFLLSLPFDFVFVPSSLTFKLNATVSFTEWFSGTSDFSRTSLGKVLTFTEYAVRDLLVLIAELTLNVVSIVLLKAHFNKKRRLINPIVVATTGHQDNHLTATAVSKRPSDAETNHDQPVNLNRSRSVAKGEAARASLISKADERASV